MTMSLLLEHFDDLLITPENAEQLNRAILSLAANGKLTFQNPNDEPASELLQRIYATKHDGTSKEKSEKKKETQELPHGWAFATIGDLVSQNGIFIDGDWVESKDQDPEGEVRLTQLADVGDGIYRNRSNRFMTREKANKLNCTFLEPNDILIARMPDPLGRACLFPGDPKPCVTVVDVCVVRVGTDDIDSKWLMYAINSPDFRSSIYNLKTGTTRQRISRGNLSTLLLKVPPLAEQKRIVARVEELFVQTRALAKELDHSQIELGGLNKSALSHLLASETSEEFNQHWDFIAEHFDLLFQTPEHVAPLRQSILELAVRGKLTRREAGDESARELLKRIKEEKAKLVEEGKLRGSPPLPKLGKDEIPYELPPGWEWERTGNVAFVTKLAGFEYTKYIDLKEQGDIPVIRAQNVRMGYLDETNLLFIDKNISFQLERSALQKKSILMTFIGAGIGDVAIFNKDERYHLAPNVAKIEIYNNFNLNIEENYLLYYLMSPFGRTEIFKSFKATAQPSLSMKTIRDVFVAIPPLAEQERIVERVEQLLSLCDALEARLADAARERGRLVAAVMSTVGG